MNRPRVVVVGAGVSGLSCAHMLLEASFDVEIWAREPGVRCVSGVAAAFWYPYHVQPPERVGPWARYSYARFAELARDPDTGVRMREAIEVFAEPMPRAPWSDVIGGIRRARADELPPGRVDGFVFEAPVIETPIYLPWLEARVRDLGGRMISRALETLAPALGAAPIVIDATGLGARALVGDRELFPIRGQIVRTTPTEVARVSIEHEAEVITYVVPRSTDCVLGGTAQPHVEDTTVDPEASAAILARCRSIEPRLRDAAVLGATVGLRPGRSQVRLELEEHPDGRCVVHDYGHGGAGVTLSWGCAREVLDLLRTRAAPERP